MMKFTATFFPLVIDNGNINGNQEFIPFMFSGYIAINNHHTVSANPDSVEIVQKPVRIIQVSV